MTIRKTVVVAITRDQQDALNNRAALILQEEVGEFEAVELRDGEETWSGKGVKKAVSHVNNEIADAVLGLDATDQRVLDQTMIDLDGTDDKSRLGARRATFHDGKLQRETQEGTFRSNPE